MILPAAPNQNDSKWMGNIAKIRLVTATVVLMLALGSIASPVQAVTNWQDKAWLDMRVLAEVGAIETGRNGTLVQIQRTCRYLDNGYPAITILNTYAKVASQSATNRRELIEMTHFGNAIMAVAVTRLCPRHAKAVDKALSM